MQQREREEKEKPVKSKTRPDRAAQVSWTNRLGKAWAQVHEPPPKARPKASPEPDQEAVPKQAPKPAAEMMVIDDDDSWGEWPKEKRTGRKKKGRGEDKEKQRLSREDSKSSETKELHKNLKMSKHLTQVQLGTFMIFLHLIQIHIGTAQSASLKWKLESFL